MRAIWTSRRRGCRGWEAGCPRKSRRWSLRPCGGTGRRRQDADWAGASQRTNACDAGQRRRRSFGKPRRMTLSGLEGRGMVGEGATARGLNDPKTPRASGTPVTTAQGNCCRRRRGRRKEQGARCKVQGGRTACRRACTGAERVWLHGTEGSFSRRCDRCRTLRAAIDFWCYTIDGRSARKGERR